MKFETQHLFIKNLNRLLSKGYSLGEALNVLDFMHVKLVNRIKTFLDSGRSFTRAIEELKFKRFVSESLNLGERCNQLNGVLTIINNRFTFLAKLKRLFQKYLLYPLLLLIIALLCFETIRLNLYPTIRALLGDTFEANKFLLFLSFHLLKIVVIFCSLIVLFFFLHKEYANIIPIVKDYRSLILNNYLELLLTCGISLAEGLNLLKSILNTKIYRLFELEKIILTEYKVSIISPFNLLFIKYLTKGIKTNDLITSLNDYREFSEALLFDKIKKITYYLQFSLFFLITANIFLIYYLIMLPMYQLSNNL